MGIEMELLERRKELQKKINTLNSELSKLDLALRELISREISEYLSENEICGISYKLESAKTSSIAGIEIRITRITKGCWGEGHEPDEDFEGDDGFDSLLKSLCNKYGMQRISVPYYYYPK